MTGVLIKSRNLDTERHRGHTVERDTERTVKPCEMEDWSDASINQGTPKMPANQQKLERGKEGFPYRFQREQGAVDTLMSEFEPPELGDNKFLLL